MEFEEEEHVPAALNLNGTEMVGARLSIALAAQENIPKIDQSAPVENGVSLSVTLGEIAATQALVDAAIAPPGLPIPGAPSRNCAPLTPQQIDEMARTVYVGNVASNVR